jgi:hypothetical protein
MRQSGTAELCVVVRAFEPDTLVVWARKPDVRRRTGTWGLFTSESAGSRTNWDGLEPSLRTPRLMGTQMQPLPGRRSI